jgi:GAF domain-containing protein
VTSPRKSGDDLITDLFEACSDLGFLTDPLDGSEFVLNLVLESIPSAVALVSFFDINAREFVVVRQGVSVAAGTQPSIPNVLLARASEFTPLLARAMRSRRAVVVSGTDVDAIHEDGRWRALGVAPRSLVVAPAISGGRYLGIVEVADPLDGAPFTEGDGHALSYIGEQFAEFLAQRELDLDRERITRPKLNQLASGQLLAGSATRPVR